MDNQTNQTERDLAVATAKAQLAEAQHRLRLTERHVAAQAAESLKAGLLMRQLGHEHNYKGRAYHVAAAKHESQEVLMDFALELLASAHLACADAHQAMRDATKAQIRSNHQA